MTIPRYRALARHWRHHPRPEWLIAGYLGFKPVAEPVRVRPTVAAPVRSDAKVPGRPPPPTGALLSLFNSLGGRPGQTVVLSA